MFAETSHVIALLEQEVTVNFTVFSSHEQPSIQWFFQPDEGGEQITLNLICNETNSDAVLQYSCSNGLHKLTIHGTTMENAGIYMLNVIDSFGSSSNYTVLDIQPLDSNQCGNSILCEIAIVS